MAEIWSQTVVDSHPMVAEYTDPQLSELKPETLQSIDPLCMVCSTHHPNVSAIIRVAALRPEVLTSLLCHKDFLIAPPIHIVQTQLDGLKAPKRNVLEENHRFPSLCQSL